LNSNERDLLFMLERERRVRFRPFDQCCSALGVAIQSLGLRELSEKLKQARSACDSPRIREFTPR
jgi:hypothetical protein